jgi:hypothetical protein
MANPSKSDSQLADKNDKPMITTQQSNVADASAPTAYTAHSSGSTPVTSNAATDLDTTAAALATLVTEVTALHTQVVAMNAILEAHGLSADS